MAIPTPDCSAASDACCTSLFDVAEFLLLSVKDALDGCLPGMDCGCEPLDFYVTLSGDDANQNALTVEIQSVNGSPQTLSGKGGMQRGIGLYRATFTIRLRESGWPMVYIDDNVIIAPDPAHQHFAARHAYAHGERMYRKLINMLGTPGGLSPDGVAYTSAQLSPLIALLPTTGVAGFSTSITMDLQWGAPGPSEWNS